MTATREKDDRFLAGFCPSKWCFSVSPFTRTCPVLVFWWPYICLVGIWEILCCDPTALAFDLFKFRILTHWEVRMIDRQCVIWSLFCDSSLYRIANKKSAAKAALDDTTNATSSAVTVSGLRRISVTDSGGGLDLLSASRLPDVRLAWMSAGRLAVKLNRRRWV
jgi:hypothetical protein